MAKKKTSESQEAVILVPSTDKFGVSLEMFTELSAQVMQIKVSDETSLAIANQKLSFVNNHLKVIEEKREELKAPINKEGKLIDSRAKELKAPLEQAVAYIKNEILEWNKEVMRKEAALRAKAAEEANIAAEKRITDYIKQVKDWLADQLAATKTIEHGQGIMESIKGLQPASVMGKFEPEYTELISSYKVLFIKKVSELSGFLPAGTTENDVKELGGHLAGHIDNIAAENNAKQEIAVMAQEEIKQEIVNLDATKANNVRFNWKFEVVDIKEVPLDFLMVDEAKIREYIKNNKDILEERTSNGIRFFKEMSVVTK